MRKMFGLGELDTAMRGTLINNIFNRCRPLAPVRLGVEGVSVGRNRTSRRSQEPREGLTGVKMAITTV